MSLRDEDLEKLDALAAEHRLSRGDAVGMLLEGRLSPPKPSREVAEVPTLEKSETVDHQDIAKAVKAEALRQALLITEKKFGVKPVAIEGDRLVKVGDWEEPP